MQPLNVQSLRQVGVRNPNQLQQLQNQRRFRDDGEEKEKMEDDINPDLLFAQQQMTETDGVLLDKYDNFYATTKSLLVLFQIMGVMPIMRVPTEIPTPHRTTFRWVSSATFWAYFIWAAETVIVVSDPDLLFAQQQMTETDGVLLDKYDNFYATTKSLLVLFQIMGVMPIMRVPTEIPTPHRTTFRWVSSATFWAYFIWAAETVIVVSVGKDRLNKFLLNPNKRFDEIIYNIIFLSILVPHFLLPVASWRHGPQVAIFKNMWAHFQLKYYRVIGEPIIFHKLKSLTWGLCIVSWGLSAAVLLSQFYLQEDFLFWHTFAYYHIIAMLNGFCSLWYVNCTAFGVASKKLATNVVKAMSEPDSAKKLSEYRHLWVDLSHMMQQLGRAYSNMYGIYCLVIFFITMISLYGALSEIVEHGLSYKELGLFVIVGYFMSLLFIICNEAYHASRKVGMLFQERLLNVNLGAVDKNTQKEVEMFLVAIAKNPPIMNLDGYTNINRELFTTNISFMATYLVVLMQFKLTLLRQAARQAMKAAGNAIVESVTKSSSD